MKAQVNLVPNYSFEVYDTCPVTYTQIYYATPWFQPNTSYGNTNNSSSSDVFNACDSSSLMGVPINNEGRQLARTGQGYAGILLYFPYNYREYIEVPLLSPLISNEKYCVEFYVSLGDTSKYATSNIGAFFSIDSTLEQGANGELSYTVIPQVENPISNVLADKNNWMLVSGNFIATGGENFLTIGNFHNDSTTILQNVSGGDQLYSYYYIDDISVIDCTTVGITEINNPNSEILISPNPTTGIFTIHTEGANIKEIKVFTVLGEEVGITNYKLPISPSTPLRVTDEVTMDMSGYAKGIYFVQITVDSAGSPTKNVVNKKVVVQ